MMAVVAEAARPALWFRVWAPEPDGLGHSLAATLDSPCLSFLLCTIGVMITPSQNCY